MQTLIGDVGQKHYAKFYDEENFASRGGPIPAGKCHDIRLGKYGFDGPLSYHYAAYYLAHHLQIIHSLLSSIFEIEDGGGRYVV